MAAASAANPKQIRLCGLLGLGKSFKTLKVSVDNSALSCGKQEGRVGDDCPSRAQLGSGSRVEFFSALNSGVGLEMGKAEADGILNY